MGHTRLQFPFSESEGGAPETSPQGQAYLSFPSLLSYRMLQWREPSGAHPQKEQYETQGGVTPAGIRYVAPVVFPNRYQGILPNLVAPRIDKPDPWSQGSKGSV